MRQAVKNGKRKKMKRNKITALLLGLSLIATGFSGCNEATNTSGGQNTDSGNSSADTSGDNSDIYTEDGKIKITIECQQSHIRADFEDAIESKFPEVDIEIAYNYSQNVLFSLQQALTHDMAPDIYMCEFIPNLGDEVLREYFVDMAAQPFVNNYYLSAIEGCSTSDGGLYYLPGPSYVYGIVYDKTMFNELGLSLPKSYTEFKELIATINGMGLKGTEPDPEDSTKTIEVPVQAFVPTIMWPDMFQIIFNTMNYETTFRGVKNAKWLNEYQTGAGSLVGHMEPAAEKLKQLFDDGILSLDYWNTKPFYRTKKLYEYHTSLMTIECQQGFEYNETYGNVEGCDYHEMGIMPIYTSDNPDSGYLYGIPRSYFGITKKGAENSAKLEAMLKIMDYLSTVEGQKQLISGLEYFGFLKSENEISNPLYEQITDAVENDRVITTFFLGGKISHGRIENYLHANTPALINGEITVEQWLKGADEVRDTMLNPKPETVYGSVPTTLQPVESAYVEGLALLNSIDADIALVEVAHNYGTVQYMYSGDITDKSIKFASPEVTSLAQPIEGDMQYVVVEVTGEELINSLEKTYGRGLAALAGVEMEVDLSKSGKEIYKSLKINGEEMDMTKTYRVAGLRGALSMFTPVSEYTELTFADMFKAYLETLPDNKVLPPEAIKIVI